MSGQTPRTESWSRFNRFLIAVAVEVPMALALVLVDAFVWHWLPWAFYSASLAYVIVALPWIMEGAFWWQAGVREETTP